MIAWSGKGIQRLTMQLLLFLLTVRAAERVKRQNAETEIPIGVFKAMRAEEFGKLMVMILPFLLRTTLDQAAVVKMDTNLMTHSFSHRHTRTTLRRSVMTGRFLNVHFRPTVNIWQQDHLEDSARFGV